MKVKAKTQKAQKRPISALSARKLAQLKEERELNMQRRADRLRKGEIPLLSYYGLKTYLKGDKVRFESQEWEIKKLGQNTIVLENEEYSMSLTVADLRAIAERRQVAVKKAKRTLLGVLKEGYDEIVFRSDRAMKNLLGSSVNA